MKQPVTLVSSKNFAEGCFKVAQNPIFWRLSGQTKFRFEEDRMDWRHKAACRDEDPELFFPIGNTGPALGQIEAAKAICRVCTVVNECLQWAIETGQDSGVWGGLSEDERRALGRNPAVANSASYF